MNDELADFVCEILDSATSILEKQHTITVLQPHKKLKSIAKLIDSLDAQIGNHLEDLGKSLKKANDDWEASGTIL